jgi:hypothetical protein
MNYLPEHHALSNLGVGMTIEQLLDMRVENDLRILRWVHLCKNESDEIIVSLFEAYEDERVAYDIYGLYAVEPDSDGGGQQAFSASKEFIFPTAEEAFSFVASSLGGSKDRFLNQWFLEKDYEQRYGPPLTS